MRDFFTYGTYRLLGGLYMTGLAMENFPASMRTGWLLYVLSPRLGRVLTDNIRHVVGPDASESQVRVLVRQACVNINKSHYDLFRVGRLTDDEVKELVRVEGWENLEQALALGRGAIVFSAHLGNVDLVMQFSVVRGMPAWAPVQRIQPERLFQYTLKLRTSHGLKLIPTDEPMMGLFRALKRGQLVALPADRDVGGSSRIIDFFGSPTRLPDGSVRVALRTGAPLVPAFALRLPDDSFLAQIEPALDLPRTGDEEADVAAGMEMVVASVERQIARHPEQWLLAAPVWPADD